MAISKKNLSRYSFILTVVLTALITWNIATYNMHANHEPVSCPIVETAKVEALPVVVQVKEEVIVEEVKQKITAVTFNRYPDDIPTEDELDVIGFESGVPGKLLMGMALKESHLDNTKVSPVGAKGMFQILDNTANFLGVENIKDNFESADAAARYLNHLHLRLFKVPFSEHTEYTLKIVLGAYNMGTKRLIRVAGGYELPNYRETREYVSDILGYYKGTKYYVERGDTVGYIVDKYDIDLAALKLLNGSKIRNLKYGIFITIDTNSYVVRKGDTLFTIATKANSSVEELAELNNIDNPALINVGDIINLG